MKKIYRNTSALLAAAVGLSLMAGCSSQTSAPAASAPAADNNAVGSILLSVNPEIEVDYDDKGNVVELEGQNDDGKVIAAQYTDSIGKPCGEVLNHLVEDIYEAGFFKTTVGGHQKNIIIKLDEGSKYPSDDFLDDLAEGVQTTIANCGMSSTAMTVTEDDYDENGFISLDKAKELAMSQLGLEGAEFTEKEYDLDDGVYELEFFHDGVGYEYELNANTGKVVEADRDHNDDWDDDHDDDKDDIDDDKDDDRDDDKDDIDDKDDDHDDDKDDIDDKDDDHDDDKDDIDDKDDDDNKVSAPQANTGDDDNDDNDSDDDHDHDKDD